jgi:hypothetical protein
VIAFHGEPAALQSVPRRARSVTLVRGGARYIVRFATAPAAPVEPDLIEGPSEVTAAIDVVRPGIAAHHVRYILEWDESHCCLAVHSFNWRDGDTRTALAIEDAVANVPAGSDVVLRLNLPDDAYARVRARRLADGRIALRLDRLVGARSKR